MSKQTENKTDASATINWANEAKKLTAFAKSNGGSRGDAVMKVSNFLQTDGKANELLRNACGRQGAQAIIEQNRNVLSKLPKLAVCIVSGSSWCSLDGLKPENRRKEDASVAVALATLLATDAEPTQRQKGVIADALKRYTQGGAGAQMPASLEALAFLGVVERIADTVGKRNAEYKIKNKKQAIALFPIA